VIGSIKDVVGAELGTAKEMRDVGMDLRRAVNRDQLGRDSLGTIMRESQVAVLLDEQRSSGGA
jgi:hypothetical protein